MSSILKTILIDPIQRSEIIFSLAHHRSCQLRVLFGSEKEKIFFDGAIINTHYKNISFSTFAQYVTSSPEVQSAESAKELIIIADIPVNFQTLKDILSKSEANTSQTYLILFKINKKYLNMIEKKLSIKTQVMEFSHNKFVGINDKLREFVEQSYDLNRAGFFAYGAFINYFRANLLQKIFRTDQIDVQKLARSFGFTTPPRVKDGKFLTDKARKERKLVKVQAKKQKLREVQQAKGTDAPIVEVPAKGKKIKKAKKGIVKAAKQ